MKGLYKHMKTVNTYVCLVDNYRRPSRQRNTAGRYLVGAKTEKEAKKLLQRAIGFGSVQVYYKAFPSGKENRIDIPMKYKEIKRVVAGYTMEEVEKMDPEHKMDTEARWKFSREYHEPRHAIAKQE